MVVRALAGIILTLTAGAAADEERFAWPLDLPRAITSSFGEYRTGRFHAGIDLRTSGIGRPVRAIEDGYAARVRCSPTGYGKAVYLALDSGHTVVFAHLDEFEPGLRDYVRAEQHRRKQYTVELTPEPGRFRFAKRQVVAYSGDTGTGPPHLHYEIRDGANRPVNPRLLGITWPDTTAPVIHGVLVVPGAPGVTIDGDPQPKILPVTPAGTGSWTTPPVRVSGPIGLGVNVIDPANAGANRLGVHTARVTANGEEFFHVRKDYLSYDTMGHGAVAWHPWFREKGPFLLTYRWPGNAAECYGVSPGDGWLPAGGRSFTARIETADFLGNTASVDIPVLPAELAPLDEFPGTNTQTGTLSVDTSGLWLTVTATFSGPESPAPELVCEGGQSAGFARVGPGEFRASVEPLAGAGEIVMRAEHPRLPVEEHRVAVFRRGEPARTAVFGEIQVTVQPNSPFGVLFLRAETNAARTSSHLVALGDETALWPAQTPIDASLTISLPMPGGVAEPRRVDAYRRSGDRWRRMGADHRDGRLVFTTGSLGTFVAMEDRVAPELDQVKPAPGSTTGLRPEISMVVTDAGSGLASITATANGRWLLMRHDPDKNTLRWEQDHDLTEGEVLLRVVATDHAGNTTVREVEFKVMKGAGMD